LRRICLRALEADPARRYPSAAALAADLRGYLRRRWLRVCVGLAAGAVLAALALAWWSGGP
jgi:hypothetical protein